MGTPEDRLPDQRGDDDAAAMERVDLGSDGEGDDSGQAVVSKGQEAPACPECGGRVWEYQEDWSGKVVYMVDAAGWHEERREGSADSNYWWLTCVSCRAAWSYEDGGEEDEGIELVEALGELAPDNE
jgi:hypothetical protein